MRISRFEDLEIWQNARVLVNLIYSVTKEGVISRDLRFCSQLQSAAISVMSNIAEGFERKSNKEFIYYLYIARGSCGEVRSLSYVALDIKYITLDEFDKIQELTVSISQSIFGFIKYLAKHERKTD